MHGFSSLVPSLLLSLNTKSCDTAAAAAVATWQWGVFSVPSWSKDLLQLGVCRSILLLLRLDGVALVLMMLAGELLSWHTSGVGPNSSGEKDDNCDCGCSPTPPPPPK